MSPLTPLHHLPRPAQNLPYLIALAVAPLINLAISINSFHHFQTLSGQQLPINHWIFGICCAPYGSAITRSAGRCLPLASSPPWICCSIW